MVLNPSVGCKASAKESIEFGSFTSSYSKAFASWSISSSSSSLPPLFKPSLVAISSRRLLNRTSSASFALSAGVFTNLEPPKNGSVFGTVRINSALVGELTFAVGFFVLSSSSSSSSSESSHPSIRIAVDFFGVPSSSQSLPFRSLSLSSSSSSSKKLSLPPFFFSAASKMSFSIAPSGSSICFPPTAFTFPPGKCENCGNTFTFNSSSVDSLKFEFFCLPSPAKPSVANCLAFFARFSASSAGV